MLLINQGPLEFQFKNIFENSGITFEETNADPALADVDNDGDLDLYITSVYKGRNAHLYLNDGNGLFTDVTWKSGTRVQNASGGAFADFNHDGFEDLVVAGKEGMKLFHNNGNQNHWIKVRVMDYKCNRFGIGSLVSIRYGDQQQTREISAGRGAGNQDATELVFGLASYSGPVEINVRSLCGDIITAAVSQPDQTVVLKNGHDR